MLPCSLHPSTSAVTCAPMVALEDAGSAYAASCCLTAAQRRIEDGDLKGCGGCLRQGPLKAHTAIGHPLCASSCAVSAFSAHPTPIGYGRRKPRGHNIVLRRLQSCPVARFVGRLSKLYPFCPPL